MRTTTSSARPGRNKRHIRASRRRVQGFNAAARFCSGDRGECGWHCGSVVVLAFDKCPALRFCCGVLPSVHACCLSCDKQDGLRQLAFLFRRVEIAFVRSRDALRLSALDGSLRVWAFICRLLLRRFAFDRRSAMRFCCGACLRFTPAVCLATNRTACGSLRFCSAGSRSPSCVLGTLFGYLPWLVHFGFVRLFVAISTGCRGYGEQGGNSECGIRNAKLGRGIESVRACCSGKAVCARSAAGLAVLSQRFAFGSRLLFAAWRQTGRLATACVSVPPGRDRHSCVLGAFFGYLPWMVHFGFVRLSVAISTGCRDAGNGERGWRRGLCASLRSHIGTVMLSAGSTLGLRAPDCAKESSTLWTLFRGWPSEKVRFTRRFALVRIRAAVTRVHGKTRPALIYGRAGRAVLR